jgi:hypothetical protein
MFAVSMLGAVAAGAYGAIHDQITFSISPEYFTKLKFQQFHYADFGLGNRAFVATIGFLATWWVGFIGAWFLARRFLPHQPRRAAFRQIGAGFVWVLVIGVAFGLIGYAYGLWRGPHADYSSWAWAFRRFEITDAWSFVRVAYSHNASYLGGAIGLLIALATIRPKPAKAECRILDSTNMIA